MKELLETKVSSILTSGFYDLGHYKNSYDILGLKNKIIYKIYILLYNRSRSIKYLQWSDKK